MVIVSVAENGEQVELEIKEALDAKNGNLRRSSLFILNY
jgi:hypothetical protein